MRLFQFLRQRPVTLLGVVICAFGVWVCWEAFDNGATKVAEPEPNEGEMIRHPKRFPPLSEVRPTPQTTAQMLPKLKPGMTRTEVEGLVGAPAPGDIHPATITDGRVTYHTTYEADLGPTPTVRPIRRPSPMGRPPETGGKEGIRPTRTLVTLEFDATKPGHPLVEVHYPDPLF